MIDHCCVYHLINPDTIKGFRKNKLRAKTKTGAKQWGGGKSLPKSTKPTGGMVNRRGVLPRICGFQMVWPWQICRPTRWYRFCHNSRAELLDFIWVICSRVHCWWLLKGIKLMQWGKKPTLVKHILEVREQLCWCSQRKTAVKGMCLTIFIRARCLTWIKIRNQKRNVNFLESITSFRIKMSISCTQHTCESEMTTTHLSKQWFALYRRFGWVNYANPEVARENLIRLSVVQTIEIEQKGVIELKLLRKTCPRFAAEFEFRKCV